MTSPLRVFISSTAQDLQAFRPAVRDAVLRAGHQPVMQEHFTAQPGTPLDVCRQEVGQCDVLVVLMAHRYGWVPAEDDGGNGEWSITRWEVETALGCEIDVLSFVVDQDAPWPHGRESDRLQGASDADVQAIVAAVRALEEFRRRIEDTCVRSEFREPDELGGLVASSLGRWLADRPGGAAERAGSSRVRLFRPMRHHALQPAPHFEGRSPLLAQLEAWWDDPAHPDRVVSLVGVGGAGKSALAERLVRRHGNRESAGGMFVWSFYEDPKVEAFFRGLVGYLGGEDPEDGGGLLSRSRVFLGDGRPHLIVLDGLERVQVEGGGGRTRGVLEEHTLRSMLRSMAAGLGSARALVTSRFALVDLGSWNDAGHRSVRIEELELDAARAVLRRWGVQGADAVLDRLALQVGRHALSLAVLGSYLAEFCDGDPEGAAELNLDEAAEDDPRAAKLGRIVAAYARSLEPVERDLMARLSTFPRGISVDLLGVVVEAGGEVAGALVGCREQRLVQLLRRLNRLGLVYSYGQGDMLRWTAHPFLRERFGALVGVASENIYEVVRRDLAGSLEARPDAKPREPSVLDRYEVLIEATRLAGRTQEAFDLFWYAMGSYRHLKDIGEFQRGVRVLAAFSPDGVPAEDGILPRISDRRRLLVAWGLFAMDVGDLRTARAAFSCARSLLGEDDEGMTVPFLCNQCWLEIVAGDLNAALRPLSPSEAPGTTGDSSDVSVIEFYRQVALVTFRGAVKSLLGEPGADQDFRSATRTFGEDLYSVLGLLHAERLVLTGRTSSARSLARSGLERAQRNQWGREEARFHTLLGHIDAHDDSKAAESHLAAARQWTERTGDVEAEVRVAHLASVLAHRRGDLSSAVLEAEAGLRASETHGFGLYRIRLLNQLALVQLDAREGRVALQHARRALDLAREPECGYAWGEADAAHLCGRAHLALGERDHSRRRFEEARVVRERIEHPQLLETLEALAALA